LATQSVVAKTPISSRLIKFYNKRNPFSGLGKDPKIDFVLKAEPAAMAGSAFLCPKLPNFHWFHATRFLP
jgi:hypothetical protein